MYSKGWDYFTAPPGQITSIKCRVCGRDCGVDCNRDGSTSSAMAMTPAMAKHDAFYCDQSGTDWHRQAVTLLIMAEDTPSGRLEEMLKFEAAEIVLARRVTKKVGH